MGAYFAVRMREGKEQGTKENFEWTLIVPRLRVLGRSFLLVESAPSLGGREHRAGSQHGNHPERKELPLEHIEMPTKLHFSGRTALIPHPTSSTQHKITAHCTRSPASSIRSAHCTLRTAHCTPSPTNSPYHFPYLNLLLAALRIMSPSKRNTPSPIPSAPVPKKPRTIKKPHSYLDNDLPFGLPFENASASATVPSQEKNDAATAKDFPAPQRMKDAESSFFGTDDSAKDIASNIGDDLLEVPSEDLVAIEIPGISDEIESTPDDDATEVETAMDDKALDLASDLQAKNAFYEASGIPSAAENSPGEVLLSIMRGDLEIKQQVIEFARESMISDRDVSPFPTDDFLKTPQPATWETQDPISDVLWDTWLSECKALGVPDDTLNTASKISGPAKANLHIFWHYPTFIAGRAIFGFTADPKNPCLNLQSQKIGPSPRVCTSDLIPIRATFERGVKEMPWGNIVPNSTQVLERSVDLTMGLLRMSRVTILVGQEVCHTIKARLESDASKELHRLHLGVKGLTIFGEEPHVLVVRCKETKQIENLIFFSFHPQSFFYTSDPIQGLYFDFVWNAACNIANIPIVNGDTFYRTVSSRRTRDIKTGRGNQLSLAIMYRGKEKKHQMFLPESLALRVFERTIKHNSEWWAANFPLKGDKTVPQLVLTLFGSKTNSTLKSRGHKGPLKEAIQTEKKSRAENLQKAQSMGRESQKSQKVARLEAFLDTYQVQQLLAKPKGSLTSKELQTVQRLEEVRSCVQTQETTEPCRKFLNTRAIFWSKKNPFGIRFRGDNAPANAPSPFTYRDSAHPCVSLDSQLKPSHKKFAREGKTT